MHNCYKILELPDFASADQIKAAYRRLARKYHPDATGGDKQLEELFKRVQNAYDVLTDANARWSHDSALRNAYHPPSYSTYTYQQPVYTTPVYTSQPEPVTDSKFRKKAVWAVAGLIVVWGFMTILFPYPTSKHDDLEFTQYDKENGTTRKVTFAEVVAEARHTHAPGYQPPGNAFRLGDSVTVVLARQGTPTTIVQTSPKEETWSYGSSIVKFRDGKVWEYADHGDNLNAAYANYDADEATGDSFSIGATRSEVFQLQGEPTTVRKSATTRGEIWTYGSNTVGFIDDQVVTYTNNDGQLRVKD